MPWNGLKHMDNNELKALYTYLQSLAKLDTLSEF